VWDDRNSLWAKKLRKRITIVTVVLIAIPVFVIGQSLLIKSLINSVNSGGPTGTIETTVSFAELKSFFIFIAFYVAFLPIGFLSIRKLRRTMILVPQHHGRVCPKCVIPMLDEEKEVSSRCPKCSAVWPNEEMIPYWEKVVLTPKESWEDLSATRDKYQTARTRLFPFINRMYRDHFILANNTPFLLLIIGYIAYEVVFGDDSLFRIFDQLWMFLPIVIAMCFFFSGMKRRRGREEYCSSCEYMKPPENSEAIPRCPECGSKWNEPGGTVYGKVSSKPLLLIISFIIFFLPFLILSLHTFSSVQSLTSGVMPTAYIKAKVLSDPLADSTLWNELSQRSMTTDERNEFAERLLDRRFEDRNYSFTNGPTWLGAQVQSKAISDTLIERYFNEMLRMQLIAPEQAAVNESVTFSVSAENRSNFGAGYAVATTFEGYFVDDQIEPLYRATEWIDGCTLDDISKQSPCEYPEECRTYSIQFDTPGTHTVRLIAWCVIVPSQTPITGLHEVTWLPNGQPSLPAETVWSKRVELTCEIVVGEK